MAYIEKTIIAGEHIFKEKGFSARYGKKNIPRGPNWNECSEVQRRRNELLKKKELYGLYVQISKKQIGG